MKNKLFIVLIIFLVSFFLPAFIIKIVKPEPKEIVFLNLCKSDEKKTEKISENEFIEIIPTTCEKREGTKETIIKQLEEEIDDVKRKQKIVDWIPYIGIGEAVKNIIDIVRFDLRVTIQPSAEYTITEPKQTLPREAKIYCNFGGQDFIFLPGSRIYLMQHSNLSSIVDNYEKVGETLLGCRLIVDPLQESFILAPDATFSVNVREAYFLEFFVDKESYVYISLLILLFLIIIWFISTKFFPAESMKKFLKKIIPQWVFAVYHWKLALLSALVYGFPSRKIKVIGVTGTKGKSTVVMLSGAVLRQGFGAVKAGWISSLTIFDGKNEVMNPFHMTMPGRFFIQKTLARMVKNGCEYAIVEVTSEGIKQSRHRFIKWAGAVFTNLAPEHLEAHGGFENYRLAKMKLFAAAARNKESFGVYNLDDENERWFRQYPVGKKYGYGALSKEILKDHFATLVMTDIRLSAKGSEFKINNTQFKTKLLGEFNVYNCAAAAAIGEACGITLQEASEALGKIEAIPGRLEIINEGQDFTVVVDLAHTPDSYEKVFRLFNELKNSSSPQTRGGLPRLAEAFSEGGRWGDENKNSITSPDPSSTEEGRKKARIISVFGSAGGGRDKWKRPELGRLASLYSDQIFITNEDPYDEDPLTIANEILAGCDTSKTDIILDRRQAISRALSFARTGDIVLVLGKGTEQTYIEGLKKIAWDDRSVAREEIKRLSNIKIVPKEGERK